MDTEEVTFTRKENEHIEGSCKRAERSGFALDKVLVHSVEKSHFILEKRL